MSSKFKKSELAGLNSSLSKSAAKLNFTAKREQPRRFGEFHGEDGMETAGPGSTIWQQTPCKLIDRFSDAPPAGDAVRLFTSLRQ